MEGNKISLGGMYKAQLWDAEADRIDAGRLVAALVSSRQALRRLVHRQNPFRDRPYKNFKIWRGANRHGTPEACAGRWTFFLSSIYAGRANREDVRFIFPSGNRWRPNVDRPRAGPLFWA